MANLNELFHGEIHLSYNDGPDFFLPIRFYAKDFAEAQKVALRQAMSDIIVEESSALDGASSVTVNLHASGY